MCYLIPVSSCSFFPAPVLNVSMHISSDGELITLRGNYNYQKLWTQESQTHMLPKARKSKKINGISLPVQWLRLCASSAEGTGLIPGQGTKIPPVMWHSQRNLKKN